MKKPTSGQSRTCPKCQGTLFYVVTGNLVDHRHAGGEFKCPQKPAPQSVTPWQLWNQLRFGSQPLTQADLALDA